MTKEELDRVIKSHNLWLHDKGGEKADLRGSDLSYSNLSGSNLSGSDLRGSNLSDSDLRGSNLSGSNLRGSDLRGSDLSGSNLSDSDLSGSNLPSPTSLLLAKWGDLSKNLTIELMRFDAANHPFPGKFDEWVKTNKCPYNEVHWQRCANFLEKRELWSPGPAKSALELVTLLFAEKNIKQEE